MRIENMQKNAARLQELGFEPDLTLTELSSTTRHEMSKCLNNLKISRSDLYMIACCTFLKSE
jgi:hypothetical protein